VTNISDNGVPDDLYARTLEQFSEEELVKLTVVIGMINTWNRLCVSFHAIHPMPAAKAA
ncbi:MAG: carboxymuconolactone decarboxylase family protein, partial [Mesorhizobium sp.]